MKSLCFKVNTICKLKDLLFLYFIEVMIPRNYAKLEKYMQSIRESKDLLFINILAS